MTIKVPVQRFEEMMNSFSGDGIKVIQRRINTQDVTGEVVDTKGRIEAKKQARDKYMELLKKARSMKEILEVQKEINSIQEELESGAGRVTLLTHQSAYSTINLTYFQYNNAYSSNPTFLKEVYEAFKNGGGIITSLVLFLITIWPLILLSIGFWILIKKWKLMSLRTVKKV
jgi:hypothetical protein